MNSGNNNNQLYYIITFGWLLIVGVIGLFLRSTPFTTLPLPYHNLLHAHSHTALLGWAFSMACLSIISLLKIEYKHLKKQILILNISIFGMLLSFLYQSYGPISIGFSTLFIITAYVILFSIYKRIPKNGMGSLIKRSIIWFYISTIGIWILGPTSALLGKEYWLYDTAIQFFLHFQINGWLLYAAMSIILLILKGSAPSKSSTDNLIQPKLLYTLDIGLILGLAPLAYWVLPHPSLLVLNAIGVLCLTYALAHIAYVIWNHDGENKYLTRFISLLLIVSILSHIISLTPDFVEALESNRNLIIAYLHLILLGIVSLTYIYYSKTHGILKNNLLTSSAIALWILGFIITETYLMLQGLFQFNIPYYLQTLWIFSAVIVVGISIIFFQVLNKKKLP